MIFWAATSGSLFASRIFAFDQLAAIEYADIVLHRDRIGSPVSMPDAQIAAICRVSSAGLATRNTKDFEYTGLPTGHSLHFLGVARPLHRDL
jgi:predicted nucleic acid-binding protein